MVFEPTLGEVLNSLGGLLFVLLGIYVVQVTPDGRKNRAFGLFAGSFGAYFVFRNVSAMWGSPLGSASPWLMVPFLVPAGIGAVWLAHALTAGMRETDRRPLALGAVAGGTFGVSHLVLLWVYGPEVVAQRTVALPAWNALGVYAQWAAFSLGVMAPLLVLLYSLVFAYGPEVDPPRRTEARLITFALVTYLGFIVGAGRAPGWGVGSGLGWSVGATAAGIVAMVGLAVLWLGKTRDVPESAATRNVSLYVLAMPLVGLIAQTAYVGDIPGSYGITRTLAVLVLAYGIVKHDVLGIERRVRWGISKTTVAGVFIAVFFVVSEGAQVLFSGFANNELLGIIAAGALLFALAPIQRLADRVAERTVPGGASGKRAVGADAEDAYRRTLRVALRDREITDEEERELLVAADELGITTERAFELRDEVREELEDEDADGGDAA